jgi:hypothetical protein
MWVALSATATPVILALIAWLQRRAIAKTARTLVASNQAVAAQAQQDHEETSAALGQIHTLVNANLTDAQRGQLGATRALLQRSLEVITLKQDLGVTVSAAEHKAVQEIQQSIDDLARNIRRKQEQTDIAQAERLRESPERNTQ